MVKVGIDAVAVAVVRHRYDLPRLPQDRSGGVVAPAFGVLQQQDQPGVRLLCQHAANGLCLFVVAKGGGPSVLKHLANHGVLSVCPGGAVVVVSATKRRVARRSRRR